MNNNYNNIYEFNENNKQKDKIEVLNKIELLDLLLSYLKLSSENNIFKKEQHELLLKNNTQKQELLTNLDNVYNSKKTELYREYMAAQTKSEVDAVKEHLSLPKQLVFVLMYITSIFISFMILYLIFDFSAVQSDIAKHGLIISIANVIAISTIIMSSKITDDIRRDFIRMICLFFSFCIPVFTAYLYREAIFSSFTSTLSTYYYYFVSLIVSLAVGLIILSLQHVIFFTKDNYNVKPDINKDKNKTYDFFSDTSLKQRLGIDKQEKLIIENHRLFEQKIKDKTKEYDIMTNSYLNILKSYIPSSFIDKQSLFLIIKALKDGYARNWQEAIIWAREESRHAETQENLNIIFNSIERTKEKITEYQKEIKAQHEIQMTFMKDINQNLLINTDALNTMQKDLDSKFKKLHRQNNSIISDVSYIQFQNLFLRK